MNIKNFKLIKLYQMIQINKNLTRITISISIIILIITITVIKK